MSKTQNDSSIGCLFVTGLILFFCGAWYSFGGGLALIVFGALLLVWAILASKD